MSDKTSFVDRILQNRILTHILFWAGFLILFTVIAALNSGSIKEPLISYLSMLPIQMIAGYLLVYYQVPKLLLKKKYVAFGISIIVSVYGFSILARLSTIYVAEPFFRQTFEQESIWEVAADPLYLTIVYFPAVYVIVFLMLIFKIIKDRFEEKQQLETIQKEKANTELKFLRAQIHPHFLFNTLNNLYSLTLTKSDVAPQVVLKLSEMLDYMLYQCNDPTIAISKEIELIQNYLDLERLRYRKQLQLQFNHQLDQPNTQIAPLILLSFIENAFKHGASGNPIDPVITIDLNLINKQLALKVYNTKSPTRDDQNSDYKTGIGTANAIRQLDLNYTDHYHLDINETEAEYRVSLKIDLS